LAEHLIDLLVRFAERLEDLAEVSVHEILEQLSFMRIARVSKSFKLGRCCFSPWVLPSKEGPRRRCLELINLAFDSPFCQKTLNANAKKDDAKAKKGETTGVGICSSDL
jgi:hypothetical protein